MTHDEPGVVNTEAVHDRLQEISGAVARLNGKPVPNQTDRKTRNAQTAVLTRELLRIDHLLSQAKVDVMSIYWSVKDQTSTGRNTA